MSEVEAIPIVGEDESASAGAAPDVHPLDAAPFDVPFDQSMTDALAAGSLVADDRSAMMAPRAAPRVALVLSVALVSIATHLGLALLLLAFVKEPPRIPQEQETAVEIVQAPPPAEAKPEVTSEAKPAEPSQAKASTASEPPKLEPKPQPTMIEPDKTPVVQAKAEAPPQMRESPKSTSADRQKDDSSEVKSLEAELTALKAEQATLQAQAAQASEPSQALELSQALEPSQALELSKALGPLPDSFRAVALPADSLGGEDVVSYRETVFSQLAKAKKADRHVVTPGSAEVVFDIGGSGDLVTVSLVHPSGNAYLDAEAIAIVRRAAPFPPPPQGALRHFSANMKLDAGD